MSSNSFEKHQFIPKESFCSEYLQAKTFSLPGKKMYLDPVAVFLTDQAHKKELQLLAPRPALNALSVRSKNTRNGEKKWSLRRKEPNKVPCLCS